MRRRLFGLDRFQLVLLLLLTGMAVFMLLPLVYLANHAFKPYGELFLFPPTFVVRNPTMHNFLELITVTQSSIVPVARYIFNSVLSTSLTVAITVLISALCAYPLSKHPFPGAKFIFSSIIISLMFAPETVQIPRYYVISQLGIINTYFGHVLPIVALPVGVFMMKQFIDQIPNELLESANLEGAREWSLFLRIVIPLCMPAVVTVAILSFQSAWSNLETSQLFMETETMKTLPFYISTLTNGLANNVAQQGAAAAAALLLFIPNLVFFLLMQKRVISTMMHSGLK